MADINFSNITQPDQALQTANTGSSGAFWPTMWFTGAIILFLSLLPFGAEVATITTLFVALIIGIPLLYSGLISGLAFGIVVGLDLFFVIYFLATSRQNKAY